MIEDAVRFSVLRKLFYKGLKTAVLGRDSLAPDDKDMLLICVFLYEIPVGVAQQAHLAAGDHGIISGHFFLPLLQCKIWNVIVRARCAGCLKAASAFPHARASFISEGAPTPAEKE